METSKHNFKEDALNKALKEQYLDENSKNENERDAQFVFNQEYDATIDVGKEKQLLNKLGIKQNHFGGKYLLVLSTIAAFIIAGAVFFAKKAEKENVVNVNQQSKNKQQQVIKSKTVATVTLANNPVKENGANSKQTVKTNGLALEATQLPQANTKKADTLKLYYKLNEKLLTVNHTRLIDSAIKIKNNFDSKIEIVSYADYIAANDYNKILSNERAKNTQEYLLKKGVEPTQIEKCEGMGEIESKVVEKDMTGIYNNRRTEIVFKHAIQEVLPEIKKEVIPEPLAVVAEIKKDTVKRKKVEVKVDSLNTLEVGQTLVLQNLNFEGGRHFLMDASEKELKKLFKTMKENPNLKIEIQGHIAAFCPECRQHEGDGYDHDNEDWFLSRNRAQYIYEYLIRKGINKKRMTYVGFGNKKPLVLPEKTEKDKEKNRRVEIKVVAK